MAILQRSPATPFVESSGHRLSLEESWELLTKLLGVHHISQDDKQARHVVSILCEWLGYLPLNLELIGQYLAEDPKMPLEEMFKRLQGQRLKSELINSSKQGVHSTLRTVEHGVKAAFELTWNKLDSMTQDVARFLSLFAPNVIPWRLVEYASLPLNWSKVDLKRAKNNLYQWKLIQSVDIQIDGHKIHPLIRECLKSKLLASEQSEKFKRAFIQAMVLVAQQIPNSPTPEDIQFITDAVPHLIQVTQTLQDLVRNEELLWLLDRLGNFYKSQGLYHLAKPWFIKCLYLAKSRLGNNHPDVATSLNNLAGVYYAQGNYSEAEPLYVQALELRKCLLGNNRSEIATALSNLAGVYYAQGRYREAEPLYLEALKLRKRFQTNNSLEIATTLNNLALLYYAQGYYGEAEPLYLEALELRKKTLGNEHLDVAIALNNLASLYEAQGRYREAETLLLQVLEISERVLVSHHSNTLILRKNLAMLQEKLAANKSRFSQRLKRKILIFILRKQT
jgi:tetratricopeptide (TPR) repeat protein